MKTLRELELEGALRRLLSGTRTLAAAVDVHGLPKGYSQEMFTELGCAEHEAETLLPAVSGQTRRVEMFVIQSYGGDSGDWYIQDVAVPVETPEHLIPALAEKVLRAELDAEQGKTVAGVGVYNIPPVELRCPECKAEVGDVNEADRCTACGKCFSCCEKDTACPGEELGGYEVKCYRTAQDFKGLVCAETIDGFSSMEAAVRAAGEELEKYEVCKAQSHDREEIEIVTRDGVTV